MSNKNEATNADLDMQEMPTVTTLLKRKKLAAVQATAQPAEAAPPAIEMQTMPSIHMEIPQAHAPAHAPTPVPPARTPIRLPEKTNSGLKREPGMPPSFKAKLFVEALDLKKFDKNLSKHKKSVDMKKLDCLGFFSSYFEESAYYSVTQPGTFKGVLGYGATILVTNTKLQTVNGTSLPGILQIVGAGDPYVGSVMGLKPDDQQALNKLGFNALITVGVFPVVYKKQIIGMWICCGNRPVSFDAKQIKAIKKIFSSLVL